MTPADDDLAARAVWSALVEPGDAVAGALVRMLGAGPALAWVTGAGTPDRSALPGLSGPDRMRLAAAARRWAERAAALDTPAMFADLERVGAVLVGPDDGRWPAGLDDLGDAAPFVLWCRGVLPDRPAVAVVGSRASTGYGERVAFDLAEGLVRRGATVVSGGAYGIDAAAHRGAILAGGPTVVVLAGGVDRSYPAGNARLFEEALATGGAVVSEVPPGALPTKSRFLQRNRLIAAVAGATVVVEAAWRSGALSTAHHAADLLRPVGAVPGPVTSAASAGCHRLLREGAAVCVTDADEVAELLPRVGTGRDGRAAGPDDDAPAGLVDPEDADRLDPLCRRVHDALGTRAGAPEDVVARRAGVAPAEARGALGLLELAGLASRRGDLWRATTTRGGRR